MFTALLAVVLTTVMLLAFHALVVLAFYSLLELYERITKSGWYKKMMILQKQLNGKIQPVVVVIDSSGEIEMYDEGPNINGNKCPREIWDKLLEAERSGSLINGQPSVRWEPSDQEREEFKRVYINRYL